MRTSAERSPRAPRSLGGRLHLADVLGAVVGVVVPTIALAGRRHGIEPHDVVALVVFVPLLLFRRRAPLPVFAAGAAAVAVITAISAERSAVMPAMVVLLFTMVNRTPRNRAVVAGGIGIAAMFLAAVTRLDHHAFAPDSFAMLAWFGLASAAGDAFRNRREYVAAVEERARRAEETRETEALRRVAEERLRIARELHDVVAHHMAVINVQAGVASHLLRTDPGGAEQALGVVRDAGRTVLDELSGLLDVLRGADDELAPATPMPTLRQIDELVGSFATVGLDVTLRVDGDPVALSDALQLTVYRLVEEALTNAHKHGRGTATVHIEHRPTEIDVRVENAPADVDAAGGPERPGGHGTVGMRERVAAMHGRITIGPVGPTFVVHAVLPHHRSTP